jgi:hypothetical protein
MDHPFGNPLVVEVEDFLAKMEVVDDERTARTDAQRVLVVGHRRALRRGQDRHIALRDLVQLATGAALQLLVMDCGGGEFRARFGSRRLLGQGDFEGTLT